MKKNIVSLVLWFTYLLLLVGGAWVVMKIQSNIEASEKRISELQDNLERSNTLLSQYQESHGSADQEIEFLKEEMAKIGKLVQEQDRLIESLAQQMSQ